MSAPAPTMRPAGTIAIAAAALPLRRRVETPLLLVTFASILLAPGLADAAACRSRSPGKAQAGKPPVVLDVPDEGSRDAACPPRPQEACVAARASRLVVRDRAGTDRDLVAWRWNGAGALEDDDVGDPAGETSYSVCVYDSHEARPFLITSLRVPPGDRWRRDSSGGWRYLASRNGPGGIARARLRNGAAGRASIRVEAAGQLVPLPRRASRSKFFHQDREVVVQLVRSGDRTCWTSRFPSSRTNTADTFTAAGTPRESAPATSRR